MGEYNICREYSNNYSGDLAMKILYVKVVEFRVEFGPIKGRVLCDGAFSEVKGL